MSREEFINYLKENQIPYEEYTEKGLDQVYVFEKEKYAIKHKHPRKYKNLYIPYIRVSNFDGKWYTRQDGWCSYMSCEKVMDIVKELGGLS